MSMLEDALSAIDADTGPALDRLFDFLKIPSVSAAPDHFADCERAADWLVGELTAIGFEATKHPTTGRPMVVGKIKAARRDSPHVLFYGHYDVQPADPLDLWRSPPFEPRLEAGPRGERIVARGASDDKGQLMTFLEACRAFQKAGGPPCAVTALFEGEEETGSPSLAPFLAENAKMLRADVALVCDTGMWNASTPAITTALRGIVADEVILTGANRDLHSGVYGGAPPTRFTRFRASSARCMTTMARSRCPASTTASRNCRRTSRRNGTGSMSTPNRSSETSA